MSHRWYYQLLLEEFGPVTETQLRQMIEDGTFASDDLVRREDSPEWIPFSALGQESSADDGGPADIADLSELSFSFEPTGPTQRRTAYSTSEPTAPSTPHKSAPPREPAYRPQETKTEVYYCKSLGQTLGPMSLTELAGMAESGSLSDTDPVRASVNGEWQPASSISELSAAFMLSDRGTAYGSKISSTTQKRLGPAAVASLNAAAITEQAPVKAPQELPVTAPPQPAHSADTTELPDKKKVRKRKGKKGEEELIDEIFDDVFADDEKKQPGHGSAIAQPLAAASTTAAAASATAGQTKPTTAMPTYSSMSPSPATLAGAAMARAAAASHASSRPSRSFSLSFEGPVKFIAIAVLLIAVIGGLIWQFGLPSLSIGGPNVQKYAGRMSVALNRYKSLGEKPSPGAWEDFCLSTRSEFKVSFEEMVASGASGSTHVACMEGMKALIALADTKVDDLARRKEFAAQVDKSLAALR